MQGIIVQLPAQVCFSIEIVPIFCAVLYNLAVFAHLKGVGVQKREAQHLAAQKMLIRLSSMSEMTLFDELRINYDEDEEFDSVSFFICTLQTINTVVNDSNPLFDWLECKNSNFLITYRLLQVNSNSSGLFAVASKFSTVSGPKQRLECKETTLKGYSADFDNFLSRNLTQLAESSAIATSFDDDEPKLCHFARLSSESNRLGWGDPIYMPLKQKSKFGTVMVCLTVNIKYVQYQVQKCCIDIVHIFLATLYVYYLFLRKIPILSQS